MAIRQLSSGKSECSPWPTQQEWVESERHLGGNQNQGIQSCRSYHPPLWLWNLDNLSTGYKEGKPLSHDQSVEDSRYHMAKTHPWHRSFNSSFSSQRLHHLDTIIVSVGRSCPHKRSPPSEKIAQQQTVSGQTLPGRIEKVLKRHWMSPWNLSVSPLITWNIWHRTETRGVKLSNVGRRSVKPKKKKQKKKRCNWAAQET